MKHWLTCKFECIITIILATLVSPFLCLYVVFGGSVDAEKLFTHHPTRRGFSRMAPNRMQKCRQKLKENPIKYANHLAKERDRDKKRREERKLKQNKTDLDIKRRKDALRQRACRKRKAEKKIELAPSPGTSNLGSYSCRQSLGKAVTKLKAALPSSPRKKVAAVRKLFKEIIPSTGLPEHKIKRSDAMSEETENLVKDFYCKDTISRLTPGRKDAKSIKDPKNGKRQLIQKRYLVMSVLEAFNLFKAEYPMINLHKSKFYELRPQHVLLCSETPHNVCVCMYHANFSFIVQTISNSVPDFPSTSKECLRALCCDTKSEKCMTNLCSECKTVFDLIPDNSKYQSVAWSQWSVIDGRPKLTQDNGTIMNAAELLQGKLKKFKTHCFVKVLFLPIFHNMKANISNEECILQIDFAENFSIIQQDEIQSAHWSHQQVTIFTGCAWAGDRTSYAVISDSLNHDKYAVYAFIKQILNDIRAVSPGITKVKIFSDGAAAQFKNKFTLANLCFMKEDFCMDCEWNFLATSHGKGAVDGIGGCVKRKLWIDMKARQAVINSAEDCYIHLQEHIKGVKIFYVSADVIESLQKVLEDRWHNILPIPQLQSRHYFKVSETHILCLLVGLTAKSDLQKVCLSKETKCSSKLLYHDVYSDSSEDEMLNPQNEFQETMPATASTLKNGMFVLVELSAQSRKKSMDTKKYKYVGICQSEIDDDNEIKVTFLKSVRKNESKLFKLIDDDVAYVPLEQIKGMLPPPSITNAGNRIYYEFQNNVDVCEKA